MGTNTFHHHAHLSIRITHEPRCAHVLYLHKVCLKVKLRVAAKDTKERDPRLSGHARIAPQGAMRCSVASLYTVYIYNFTCVSFWKLSCNINGSGCVADKDYLTVSYGYGSFQLFELEIGRHIA